jgi:hypothetical protein
MHDLHKWKRTLLLLTSGAMLLQAPGCAETAVVVTSIATTVSAAGVVYIVARILG